MKYITVSRLYSLLFIMLLPAITWAQSDKEDYLKTITTAVPFLTITPDARGGALADAGVATTPDVNSTYWNVAKLAFAEKPVGFGVSYNPWLRKLVNDMSLSYLSGYKKIRKEDAVGFSFKYFDLGQVTFTDNNGSVIRDFSPNELSVGIHYARMLSKSFSVGLGLKYIRSDLAGNFTNNSTGQISKAINSASVDIGCYYQKEVFLGGRKYNLGLGANISDIGPKVTYTTADNRDFIPTNLRIGTAISTNVDAYNKFTFAFDINKLMVPTPQPLFVADSSGNLIYQGNESSDKGVLGGMFSSFADAPGGLKEELQELILCIAGEYWYNDLFAVRAGYHYESPEKGNRRYVTVGLGVRYQVFGLDLAYLIPVQQNNPLAESIRMALLFQFDAKRKTESVQE
ncbi:MAG: type IX secretion system outer membrane channel protein PorV [Cytophagaceae bacterium]|nr:type IX secretion system outer membrane channel protein PorV [Cytophagaceae bacterium]